MTAFYLNAHVAIFPMSANLAAVVMLFSKNFPAVSMINSLCWPIVHALRTREMAGVSLKKAGKSNPEVNEFRPDCVGFSSEKKPSGIQLATTRRSIEKSTHIIHFESSDLMGATKNLLSAIKMPVLSLCWYAKGRLM